MQPDATTRLTTAGGTLLVLIQIRNEELLKAIVLAGVGALVSFSVSLLLKWLFRKIIKSINKNKK